MKREALGECFATGPITERKSAHSPDTTVESTIHFVI